MEKRISVAAVVVNLQKDTDLQATKAALAALDGCAMTLRMPKRLQAELPASLTRHVIFCAPENLYDGAECVIVLGGDGSVIKAASDASRGGLPIVGINLGRVGYLAEVERDALPLLCKLSTGEYHTERRMMLDVRVLRDGKCIHQMKPALNDAVISNGAISHMVDLSVCCDGQYLGSYHADGMIAATPTGSTAYSMSAGGPIIDPTLDCICLTPVCSHSLTARPILFAPDSVLTIENICTREDNTSLTVDGDENFKLLRSDTVEICASEMDTTLIRIVGTGFVAQLNRKFT